MAVEDSIPVTGVGHTRLDIDWEEGSKELKNHHRKRTSIKFMVAFGSGLFFAMPIGFHE